MGQADQGGVWECGEGGDWWLEVSEGRDQVGGEGSQIVGESQLTAPPPGEFRNRIYRNQLEISVFRWAHLK